MKNAKRQNNTLPQWPVLLGLIGSLTVFDWGVWPALAIPNEPVVVFYTGFETSEGYPSADSEVPLRGTLGWKGEGSGGNGFTDGFFPGLGQQAFLGYKAPAPKDGYLVLWKPLDAPTPWHNIPVWRFSVWFYIGDSTNGRYDDFRWTAYNKKGEELFSVGFDNSTLDIYFGIDDDIGFYNTGFYFFNNTPYFLEIWMNFVRNQWQARINGVVVVDAQPITTKNKELSLGDIDAVWLTRDPNAPGDNYMVFDEYQVTIEPYETIPPVLELLGFNEKGQFQLLVHGERNLEYTVEISSDLTSWRPLETKKLEDGYWLLTDIGSAGSPITFYRCYQGPSSP